MIAPSFVVFFPLLEIRRASGMGCAGRELCDVLAGAFRSPRGSLRSPVRSRTEPLRSVSSICLRTFHYHKETHLALHGYGDRSALPCSTL